MHAQLAATSVYSTKARQCIHAHHRPHRRFYPHARLHGPTSHSPSGSAHTCCLLQPSLVFPILAAPPNSPFGYGFSCRHPVALGIEAKALRAKATWPGLIVGGISKCHGMVGTASVIEPLLWFGIFKGFHAPPCQISLWMLNSFGYIGFIFAALPSVAPVASARRALLPFVPPVLGSSAPPISRS